MWTDAPARAGGLIESFCNAYGARRVLRAIVIGAVGLTIGMSACSSRGSRSIEDQLARAGADDRSSAERVAALASAAELGAGDEAGALAVRSTSERLAWDVREPVEVRVAAFERLRRDPGAEVREGVRRRARIMLPTEPRRGMVDAISRAAAEEGWSECTASLVRSLSRAWADVPDGERPEAVALRQLNPGESLEAIAFSVFAAPPDEGPTFGVDWSQRASADAWDVLDRMDPSGERRRAMVVGASSSPSARGVAACERELHAFPRSGEELRWVLALARAENIAWWASARNAAALGLSSGERQQVRNAEALRWASEHRVEWLGASRETLLGELSARLASRQVTVRSSGVGAAGVSETLGTWAQRLSRTELIHILALDESLRDESMVSGLFAQARMDREDTTTEYGGTITARDALRFGAASIEGGGGGEPSLQRGGFVARLYPPRPSQRLGDERFVASEEMAGAGILALAHYHFHAQRERNSAFAGPSRGDLEYANRMGRTCLVFTSLSEGVFGVDLYTPEGVVLDLGQVLAGNPSKDAPRGNTRRSER